MQPSERTRSRTLRRSLAGLLAVALAMAGLPPSAAAQGASLGPLASEDGAPLHRLGLTAPSEAPEPVPAGTVKWGAWVAFSNIFEQDSSATHVLMIDMERLIKTTHLRVGLHDRFEIGGRLTFERTGGGNLDGFVTWWHARIGVENGNRERVPNGVYDQRLEDGSGGTVIDVEEHGPRLEDVRLFAKWLAIGQEGSRGALSLRTTVRAPTAQGVHVEERTDFGASLLGRLSGARWHGHGMVGVATVRARARLADTFFRQRAYHALVGVERSLGERLAAVVQYQISTPLLRDFDHRELDGPSANLVLGVTGRIAESWRWDVSFQEDLPPDTPAPDFTVGFRFSRAW
jgi:hypothetical protein